MSLNLQQEKIINQLTNDVGELKRQVRDLRTNQTGILRYGDITINGNTNQITLGDPPAIILDSSGYISVLNSSSIQISRIDNTGYKLYDISGNEITRLDYQGIGIKSTGTTGARYIYFMNSGTLLSDFVFQKYTPASAEVTSFFQRTIQSSSDNRVTYTGWQIYKSDQSTRDTFLEMADTYTGGIFTESTLSFSKDGATRSWGVTAETTGGLGYMDLPWRASDPTAFSGRMYYNTSTGKVRLCEGATFRDA